MAETKYIDANKVIDYANQEITATFYYPQDAQEQRKQDEQAYRDKWAFVKQIMVGTPAADVMEAVRCKDCKHWREYVEDYPTCAVNRGVDGSEKRTKPMDFCSYGKRKENE